MIVQKEQAKYHLDYLKALKPIKDGRKNEVLNDGYQRVLFSEGTGSGYVRIESLRGEEWLKSDRYYAETGPLYCKPSCCGLSSEPSKVARRLTELLAALGRFEHITTGRQDDSLVRECDEFRLKIHYRLISEGWRIRADINDWKVLQPLKGKRNDNHERGA